MTETQALIRNLLVLATVLPLVSSIVVLFVGKRYMQRASGWFATAVMAVGFGCSVTSLLMWLQQRPETILWTVKWIPLNGSNTPWLYLGALIDGLTVAMMTMVTGVATLVHLYSIGYMTGDKRFERFFAYLSLFTFSMLGIVISNSIMQLFVFWELVGFTSYLLIGFWFEKRGPQLACKKAFVMNRVGDMGFLIGFGILMYQLDGNVLLPAAEGINEMTSMFGQIQAVLAEQSANEGLTGIAAYSLTNPPLWLTAAGIGLFFGAIGKSAQFPLHTWLPDAMEGPTPVSSIVHSATMVAAGVYLTSRIYPILTPGAHLFISTIGLITLVMAACMALVMTDIKRVLAYSTLSQLGYMILGLGTGAYAYALFHLITHAFFKCCLFQCSGSVINAAHHQQDMRYYGGLAKKLPITATCFFVSTLAIAGASIPFTEIGISGFYSKDGIIAGTVNYGHAMGSLGDLSGVFYWGPTIVAYVTVFYMARCFALTFLGKPRDQHLYNHAHEVPWTMWLPQACLAVMAIMSAPIIMPFWLNLISSTEPTQLIGHVQTAGDLAHGHAMHTVHVSLLNGLGWIIALVAGLVMYQPGMGVSSKIVSLPGINLLYKWALNKFYFDELYDGIMVAFGKIIATIASGIDKFLVDGMVNLVGIVTKVSSSLVGWFDSLVVDGAVNGAATAAANTGNVLRRAQTGRIRAYVLFVFASASITTLMIVTVVLARG